MISFGNYNLLKQLGDGATIYGPTFTTELERQGLVRRFGALQLCITGLGVQYLLTHRPPPFPALKRSTDPRCPRCDELPPISLCQGEGK